MATALFQPHTEIGRALAVVVVLVGISFVAMLTGVVAERFLARDVREESAVLAEDVELAEEGVLSELRHVQARLAAIEKMLVIR